MSNLVVRIWQYQESETMNKYRESSEIKTNSRLSLALPKTKSPQWPSADFIFSSSRLYIFFVF